MFNFIPKLFYIFFPFFLLSFTSADNWTTSDLKKLNTFFLNNLNPVVDVSNKYILNENAKVLGKSLFSDTRLSSNKLVSCATCHIKDSAFTDNKNVAVGLQKGFRNTPTLMNAAHHNWFFADGSKDSLWAQVLSSLENPSEQDFTRVELLKLFHQDPTYLKLYNQTFEQPLPLNIENLPDVAGPNSNLQGLINWKKIPKSQREKVNFFFTNVGKAIAAYVTTIQSDPSSFDLYVQSLKNSSSSNSSSLSESALNGYKLFISNKAGCANCHNGPLFTNKEFHNIGTGILAKDNGRSEVIDAVIHDEFNCLSKYSDAKPGQCIELNYVNRNKHALSGAFKTPSLRNISKTAPYMHDGRFADLNQVLEFYSSISKEKALAIDLPEISLTKKEQQDIISFLLTL